jgi:membrane-associated protease RseP (regulator of RpoE activity)
MSELPSGTPVPFDPQRTEPSSDDAARDDHHVGEAALLEAQATALFAGDLLVESVEMPIEPQLDGLVVLRGRLLRPSADVFPRWLRELNKRDYTPLLRPDPDHGSHQPNQVVVRIGQGVGRRAPSRTSTHIILFVLTVLSTLFVGATVSDAGQQADSLQAFLRPTLLLQGWPFALALLSILTAHEFGHYFAAKYHKVAVTLPFFIPMPLGFGTLGAFIQLREPVRDRRQLFDIGVAGPLAGLALAVPTFLVGLATSQFSAAPPGPNDIGLGDSLFTLGAQFLVFGQWLSSDASQSLRANQLFLAGWIGLLVTALNLLPVGQLDGGHTVFAMFGEKARTVNLIAVGALALLAVAGLGVVQAFAPWLAPVGYTGWFIWLFLIFFIIGPFHPPALDDVTELDAKRKVLGFVMILIFVLTFMPAPLQTL